MKILLTVHQFFPEFTAGTEVLTRAVALQLVTCGHQVRVLTGFPDDAVLPDDQRFDEYEVDGLHVYRFRHGYMPMGGQTSLIELGYDNHLAANYFAQILAQFQPDVVHFFHLNRLGTGLIDKAVAAGVKAFFTPTDFWAICPTAQLVLCNGQLCSGPSPKAGNCVKHFAESSHGGAIGRAASWLPTPVADALVGLTLAGLLPPYPRRAEVKAISGRLPTNVDRLNKLHKIVSPTSFMTRLLLRYGVRPQRMVQCAFGIDTTDAATSQPGRASPGPDQPLRIGFIGTLAQHKGCHVLVEAFKALPARQAVLKIYGSLQDFPDYSNALLKSAAAGGTTHTAPDIEFCGTFPNAHIGAVLAGLDVLVVPSLWYENTPLVLYSAQAASCAVVASDFPGISEVIRHGLNGLLFEAGNVAALATQLRRLLNEQGLVQALGAHAQPPKSSAIYVDELLAIWAHSND